MSKAKARYYILCAAAAIWGGPGLWQLFDGEYRRAAFGLLIGIGLLWMAGNKPDE